MSPDSRTIAQLAAGDEKSFERFNDVVETPLLTTPSPDRQLGARDDDFR
jgi:hypothetical protein